MRVAFFSLDFGLLLLALVALIHVQGIIASADSCPSELCVPAAHCQMRATVGTCAKSGTTCCSLLKRQHMTLCRHFGGDCRSDCPQRLTERATDCPADKNKCCVLV